MRNEQLPEHRDRGVGQTLDIHSIFLTIQGEGPYAGRQAVFIRLAGCNLQCPNCDTDYTSLRVKKDIPSIVKDVQLVAERATLIVITGGEPFRQRLAPLVVALMRQGFAVQIESNGTLHETGFPYERVTLVVSPKTGSINPMIVEHIAALKYVGRWGDLADDDGLPLRALDHPAKPRLARPPEGFRGEIFLQPEDSYSPTDNHLNVEAVKASCREYGYRLCLQLHKIINVE